MTFRSFLLVLNHMRIKVACKVAKSFLTLFPVTLVKVEVQESNLHQMNHKKVYFLTCFMQNVQKLNMVGSRALNDRSNHYGPPCNVEKHSRTPSHNWKDLVWKQGKKFCGLYICQIEENICLLYRYFENLHKANRTTIRVVGRSQTLGGHTLSYNLSLLRILGGR